MNQSSRVWRGIVRQFGKPTGLLGSLAGMIMARRKSNRRRNHWTLDLLGIQSHDRVLEVGFGPGLAIERAAELAPQGTVAGIDHSEVMLRQATRRNAAAIATGRVELHAAAIDGMPDFGQPFDKIFGANVHFFWNDLGDSLRCLGTQLKAGGTLALTFQPRKPGATHADSQRAGQTLRDAYAAAGFEQVRVEVLELKPHAICVLGVRPRAPAH